MPKKKTFESSLEQLREILKELEYGNLPLEDALKKFEKGMDCSNFCLKKLDETEEKISILLKNKQGNLKEELFLKSD